jgi:hypothetical protein
MATIRRRRSIKLLICPGCEEEGTLRKILYGMPDPETFDFEKYAVGGCVMNGDGSDPDIACRECEWSGFRDRLVTESVCSNCSSCHRENEAVNWDEDKPA